MTKHDWQHIVLSTATNGVEINAIIRGRGHNPYWVHNEETSYVFKRRIMMAKFKKPRKQVRFAEAETTEIESPSVSTAQPPPSSRADIQSRWYSKGELNAFKSSSVQLVTYSRRMFGINALLPRGLEAWTRLRSQHRAKTVRCVVAAYKQGRGADYTAELSRKLSGWNTELAFTDACRDYFECYRPMLAHLVPYVLSGPPHIFLVPKKRRGGGRPTADAANELECRPQNRRVRRKMV
jgi:hypothetical protein